MSTPDSTKIAVIGGDGTGPEVTAEALKVLQAASQMENFDYQLTDFDFGGERYLKRAKFCRTEPSTHYGNRTRFFWEPSGTPT